MVSSDPHTRARPARLRSARRAPARRRRGISRHDSGSIIRVRASWASVRTLFGDARGVESRPGRPRAVGGAAHKAPGSRVRRLIHRIATTAPGFVRCSSSRHIVRLGDAFDHALTDPDIAAAWCPRDASLASQKDIEARLVKEAIFDRISKLDLAPINEAIAETAAAIKANAKDSVISFGPQPRRSGE